MTPRKIKRKPFGAIGTSAVAIGHYTLKCPGCGKTFPAEYGSDFKYCSTYCHWKSRCKK